MKAKSTLPARHDELTRKYKDAIAGTKSILVFGSAMLNQVAALESEWHGPAAIENWLKANHPEIDPVFAKRLCQRAEAMHRSLGMTRDADLGGLLEANPRGLAPAAREIRKAIEDLIKGRGVDQMRFEFDFNLKQVSTDSSSKTQSRSSSVTLKEQRNALQAEIDSITRGNGSTKAIDKKFSVLAVSVMLMSAGLKTEAIDFGNAGREATAEEAWGALLALLMKNVCKLTAEEAELFCNLLRGASGGKP